MSKNLTQKILEAHRVSGNAVPGETCAFRVDSVLFHDMSGLLAFMAYDAMDRTRAGAPIPVVFNDHNLVVMDTDTADSQAFIKSAARRFGLWYSQPGNGICHSVYSQRLGRPGMLLIGADSHTATCGALGMLGVGMGGMDTAVAMCGEPFPMTMPRVMRVWLDGKLADGVSAKDAALELLGRLHVSGAVGRVLEYTGPGVGTLSVPQRATLANMGAEMGATSSIFPSDEQVRAFLRAQGRPEDYQAMSADNDARYDECITLDLTGVKPSVALPGQPDRVMNVADAPRAVFSQIFIGSCTNGSYTDLARAALVLKGRRVCADTAVLVACPSRQVYRLLERDGYLRMLTDAGARILECACGPCMGIGQAPAGGAVILRTTNRNYCGRSGTGDAQMYLCGTETAAASAVTGRLTAASELMDVRILSQVREPDEYLSQDDGLTHYPGDSDYPLLYTSNIRPIPVRGTMPNELRAAVSLKAGNGISTDDIVPPDPRVLSLRPNIPELSKYLFARLDADFAGRAAAMGESVIVAGRDYAQGSSREHAAIGCMYLGVRAVLTLSIHRIHRANLINYGVLPLLIESNEDYEAIHPGDELRMTNLRAQLEQGRVEVENLTSGRRFFTRADLNARERMLLLSGGLLPAMRTAEGKKA